MTDAEALAAYAAELAAHQKACLLAATMAVEASSELLRFQAAGPVCNHPFGDVEVIAKLAEALLLAARVESDHLAEQPAERDYCNGLGQLAAACAKFLADQLNVDLLATEIDPAKWDD